MNIHFQSARPMATPATTSPVNQPVRFAGQKDEEVGEIFERLEQRLATEEALPKVSIGERLKYASQVALKSGFSKEGFIHDTKWAAGICIATCWLPGSQLLTVPINYGIFITVRMIYGACKGWAKAPLLKELGKQLAAQGE